MTGTLRVTPEKLKGTSDSFKDSSAKVQTLMSNMLSTVDSLSSTWGGEAATAYTQKAHSLEDDINKMVRMIQEHSTDLAAMAMQYEEAERVAQETANALQADVIA